jgi:hypothetical protein
MYDEVDLQRVKDNQVLLQSIRKTSFKVLLGELEFGVAGLPILGSVCRI